VMTRPALMRAGLALAPLGRMLPGRLGAMARSGTKPRRHVVAAAPVPLPDATRRVALMPGCAQAVLAPEIDQAVARILARRGIELVPLAGAGCCGSLVHHLGRSEDAKAWGRRAIEAFERAGTFDAILITATGCSAYLKDLEHVFAGDPAWQPRAAVFAAKTRDFLELVTAAPAKLPHPVRVAWQAPCSLQNGLKLADAGRKLLADAGFEVMDIPEGHLCCGSAGSYSILQPGIAAQLRTRKLANIAALKPDVIATANIGCLHHLSGPDAPPIVHFAELIDWAEGGAAPAFLETAAQAR
jgi:glycolate oxidase iron-sulfur subunit